jgi:p38 MAP kinase
MLNWQKYTHAMDIWSVGCILAEMYLGKVLFPGKDHISQFVIITQLLGSPPEAVMDTVTSRSVGHIDGFLLYCTDLLQTLKFLRSLSERQPTPLEDVFPMADPSGE